MRTSIVTIALVLLTAVPSAPLSAQQDTAAKWYERLRFEGDARVRYEYFSQEEVPNRGRFRIRMRAGFTLPISGTVTAGVRIATLEPGSVTSHNVSLTGALSSKTIALDRAFVTWTPSNRFQMTGGKFALPLIRPAGLMRSEMIFDDEVAPEGFHEQVNLVVAKEGTLRRLAILGEQWSLQEVGNGPDTWLMGAQGVAELSLSSRVSATLTTGYHSYLNGKQLATARNSNGALLISNSVVLQDGTVLEGGRSLAPPSGNPFATFASDFELLTAAAGVSIDRVFGRMPLQVYVDVVRNGGASADRSGVWAGASAGNLRRRGDWAVSVLYTRVETEAVMSMYSYSDLGIGGTNNAGPVITLQYRPGKDFTLSARHHLISPINEAAATSPNTLHRLMLDAAVAF
jgi:hypothetical protein